MHGVDPVMRVYLDARVRSNLTIRMPEVLRMLGSADLTPVFQSPVQVGSHDSPADVPPGLSARKCKLAMPIGEGAPSTILQVAAV